LNFSRKSRYIKKIKGLLKVIVSYGIIVINYFKVLNYVIEAFAITETELNDIAKAAIIGESKTPKKDTNASGNGNSQHIEKAKKFCLIFRITA
jgi:hypothetical protein